MATKSDKNLKILSFT